MVKFTKSGVDTSVCAYCFAPLNELNRSTDHLFPKSRGGKLSNKNKVPACKPCNELKGSLSVTEFNRAISSLMNFEAKNHREKMGYLKKVKRNVEKIIEDIKTK